jgi:hypothetical protein
MNITVHGVKIEVEFEYHRARRGARDSFGVPMEPDDPEDVEIKSVKVGGAEIIALLGMKEIAEIEEAVITQMKEDAAEWKQDRYWRTAV